MNDTLERIDSLELERVDSVESEKDKGIDFATCPGDLRFVFTFVHSKRLHFDYILKKDKPLPYERELKGYRVIFKKNLGVKLLTDASEFDYHHDISTNHYTFTRRGESNRAITRIRGAPITPEDLFGFGLSPGPSPGLSGLSGLSQASDFPSIGGSIDQAPEGVREVVVTLVPGVVPAVVPDVVPAVAATAQAQQSETDGPGLEEEVDQDDYCNTGAPTVHTDPNYKENLKKNFVDVVLPTLSKRTRDAWSSNQKIIDQTLFKEVRVEIKKALMRHVLNVFGTVKSPKVSFWTSLVSDVLSPGYPFMFGQGEQSAAKVTGLNYGRDLGGKLGIKNLPTQLWDEFYRMQTQLMKEEGVEVSRGGVKTPELPGINKIKYAQQGTDVQKQAVLNCEDEACEAARQEVYSENWPAIMEIIRTSNKRPDVIIRGFFKSPLHIEEAWKYLTGLSVSLAEIIETNLEKQVYLMEQYLIRKDRSKDRKLVKKISEIEKRMEMECDGNETFKRVEVIRLLATTMEKSGGDGRGIFLYAWEDPICNEPYLKVHVLSDSSMKFELYCDRIPLLPLQDMPQALASFFHLCFTFQMRYAEKSQTAICIIQQYIAKYGSVDSDVDLSQNKKRKKVLAGRISEYRNVLTDLIMS